MCNQQLYGLYIMGSLWLKHIVGSTPTTWTNHFLVHTGINYKAKNSSRTFGKIGKQYLGRTIWSRSLSSMASLPFMIGAKQRRRERRTCLQKWFDLYCFSHQRLAFSLRMKTKVFNTKKNIGHIVKLMSFCL